MARAQTNEWTRRHVAALAWREAKATADVHHQLGQVWRAVDDPSSYFINVELGFGFGEGPSIISTMQDLDRINRAHCQELKTRTRKKKPKGKRFTSAELARMLEAQLADIAADVR